MTDAREAGGKDSKRRDPEGQAAAPNDGLGGGTPTKADQKTVVGPFGALPPEWQSYVDRVAERMSQGEDLPVTAAPRRMRRSARILIVDDEPAIRQVLATALQDEGFPCETAGSGAEAIAQTDGHAFDVAIVDLVMPDMSGLDVMREIRRRNNVTRVILITGYGDMQSVIEALRARADDYLLKPIKAEALLASVRRALGRQEALRGIRLSHQQLSQQLARANLKLQRRFAGGVVALATALEARDPFTKGHSSRVATTCVEISRVLGFHGEDLDDLAVGALLHDVGKIAVPDSILRKEGRLSREEFQQIQCHPGVGYEILYPFFGPGIITDCALYHHERCDGTGYPKGLREKDLPLVGRIISLCDAFDAMNSVRPYRGALSETDALREIEKHRGTQFDPQIADLFCSLRPYHILRGESGPEGSVEPQSRPDSPGAGT